MSCGMEYLQQSSSSKSLKYNVILEEMMKTLGSLIQEVIKEYLLATQPKVRYMDVIIRD